MISPKNQHHKEITWRGFFYISPGKGQTTAHYPNQGKGEIEPSVQIWWYKFTEKPHVSNLKYVRVKDVNLWVGSNRRIPPFHKKIRKNLEAFKSITAAGKINSIQDIFPGNAMQKCYILPG